jgi:cytochrome c553
MWQVVRSIPAKWRAALAVAIAVVLILGIYTLARLRSDSPVRYADALEHFKYGSTGGEKLTGIPYAIWMILPSLFPEYLDGKGYETFGFLYEKGRDLPIGVSKRRYQGLDRVSFNCAICHVGSVRENASSAPHYYAGMPSNTVDLRGFYQFVFAIAEDPKFNGGLMLAEMKERGIHEDLLNRLILKYYAVGAMRSSLLDRKSALTFILQEPEFGPGRIDTFSPAKALLHFNMKLATKDELIGTTDLPSIWFQRKRQGMQLHWDGNNTSVQERNRSAAFGTGAYPPTLDRKNIRRVEDWLLDACPPKYLWSVDSARAARGQGLYKQYCAECHGVDGKDFAVGQGKLGTVIPISKIGTDRHRLDSYTYDLAVNQNLLYAEYGNERFQHFRKTDGYAAMPLDGVWLRAPYLHNGSVPTARDLLNGSRQRTKIFYRGDDVYDQAHLGFKSNVLERNGKKFFRYDTSVPGNSNAGHEGKAYGTELADADKDALVEYLKTF